MSNETQTQSVKDEYQYAQDCTRLQKFLWWCAGADRQLLMKCPVSDRVKEEGIGGVVLATGLLAFFAGSFAFFTVFAPKEGISYAADGDMQIGWVLGSAFAGFVWACIIFNLDRFVVSSTGHGDGTDAVTGGEIVRALPRIFMALFIGLTISKPLEIRIMKTEIDSVLHQRQQDYERESNAKTEDKYKDDMARLGATLQAKKDRLTDAEQDIRKLEAIKAKADQELADELGGRGGSGKVGDGPVYRLVKGAAEAADANLKAKVSKFESGDKPGLAKDVVEAQTAFDALKTRMDKERAANEGQAHHMDGMIERIKIAHDISPVASWLLTVLLITLEVAPIFFKMMLIKGPYAG